jgi:excisionase family DNA binding protein
MLHSVTETAELLGGCSDMHVYRLIAAGELRAVDIATPGAGRSKTRIRSDDLAGYIDRKTRGRTA